MDGTIFIGYVTSVSDSTALAKQKKAENCPDENTFARYLDNTLESPERDAVEGYLATSSTCRGDFYEIRTLLEKDNAEKAPEQLADSVKNKLQTQNGVTPNGRKLNI